MRECFLNFILLKGIFGSVALIFLNLALKFEDATKIGMVINLCVLI